MSRVVLRSTNEQVVLPDVVVAQPVTQVVYEGPALVGAMICASAEVQTLTPNGSARIAFQSRVRRFGRQRNWVGFVEVDPSVAGTHRLGVAMIEDLVPGDIIECLLGYDITPQAVLVARGFTVVIL